MSISIIFKYLLPARYPKNAHPELSNLVVRCIRKIFDADTSYISPNEILN